MREASRGRLEARMRREKRWNLAEPKPGAADLAARLKVSPLVAQILVNRGITDASAAEAFLKPSLKSLHDPQAIPGLTHAAERIARAIRDNEKIVIYGDYDVDGITATAILWHAIRALGGTADFYVPHRIEEGYGLNSDALAQICKAGTKLIVSVDCGITAIEPAKVAKARGVDLIITDHHEFHSENGKPLVPDCCATVHPRLPSDAKPYPNEHLCGAGVAFKLAWGIGSAVSGAAKVSDAFRQVLLEATGLAALGTIADVVPLVGENRALAHFGLSGLKASKLTGIQALISSANLTGQKLDSFHVGFLLAPRLNACGRMGHAKLAIEMLTSQDAATAQQTATYLEQQNRKRQAIEREILDQALEQIEANGYGTESNCAIVVGDERWHPGVVGIVASRIVDRFHRPAIVVALNNGHGQGSGRSITGFHLAHALQSCAAHLDAFGGHEMAVGLKIQSDQFERFRESFCAEASRSLTAEQLTSTLKIDATAELKQITSALVIDLARLGPFGHGNRKPLLCIKNVELSGPPRRAGKTADHLQLHISQGGRFMKCIAFGQGDLADTLKPDTHLDLAGEPTLNTYNGNTTVELDVKDICAARVH